MQTSELFHQTYSRAFFFPLKSKFTEKNALIPLVFPENCHIKNYYFPVCKIKLI